MDQYKISNNFLEIITGTNNTISKVYQEAVKDVDNSTPKAMGYLKNFITSIENIASKDNVKDQRITSSKGNITNFNGFENIQTAMGFLEKNLGKIDVLKDLSTIFNTLKQQQPLYTEGYEKNIRLIVLEYESAVYLLVTGLSSIMSHNLNVIQNGTEIKIQKNDGNKGSIVITTIKELSKQLGSPRHKEYLEELIHAKDNAGVNTKIEESVSFIESAITDTFEMIDSIFSNIGKISSVGKRVFLTIKNSIFGILPLIRSILYMRYKKKADTILALDQQVQFINMNIEQLQNKKNMDPAKKEEIIKRQKAVAEAYNKKAAKLRAELSEGEKDATESIKKEDPSIKNTDDGDFVLEGGINFNDMFTEISSINDLKYSGYERDAETKAASTPKPSASNGSSGSSGGGNEKAKQLADLDSQYKQHVAFRKAWGNPALSKTDWLKEELSSESPFYPGNEDKLAKLKNDMSNIMSLL